MRKTRILTAKYKKWLEPNIKLELCEPHQLKKKSHVKQLTQCTRTNKPNHFILFEEVLLQQDGRNQHQHISLECLKSR